MKNILILGVSAVQLDAISVLKKMGVRTYSCAYTEGIGSGEADHFVPINFVEEYQIIEYIRANGIGCIYSVGSDVAMPVCARISETLGLSCFVTYDAAMVCNNKNQLRAFLGNGFRGNVRYQVIGQAYEDPLLEFPLMMKPSDSQGQRGVRLIRNRMEFLEHFNACKSHSRAGLIILEDYIDGPEISVNVYILDGKIVYLVPSDRITWPQFQGGLIHRHIVPSAAARSCVAEIQDLTQRIVDRLGIKNGPLYLQLKMRDGQPYLIEATPRLDGCHMWILLQYFSGVNLLTLTFEHLLWGKTDELRKFRQPDCGYSLEFLCAEPYTRADYSASPVPARALTSFFYYKPGDIIRPVNGQYEKIGYFVTEESGCEK